jgi:hypothetical protein
MVKTDINGAYIQTPMTGESVDMRVTNQVVNLFSKYRRFVDERGVMCTMM